MTGYSERRAFADRLRADACDHGPGMARCGHPDCVGARAYYAGTLIDFTPDPIRRLTNSGGT